MSTGLKRLGWVALMLVILISISACGSGNDSNATSYPYDGVWSLNLSNGVPAGCGTGSCVTSGNTAVSSGAFSITGAVSCSTTLCGALNATRTIAGTINSSGVVSGAITNSNISGDNFTFAGNCTSTNSCTASGSNNTVLTLTR